MDTATFKLQFLPCHRKLFQVAYRFMANAQDAEDMVQEAYLKLWSKRDQLDEVQNAEAYSVAILKNLCYDALRRARPEEDNHPPEELNLPDEDNQAADLDLRDEADCVRQLIKRLPRQQRLVMTLRDVNDCSMEEIQQATGLNAINIRSLLSRARKKIREQFNAIKKR